jgi:glutamate formiminotransferase/formiminotetrahydrofolate cyclodeaminase
MNLDKSLQEYFNDLSSSSPTPGGGNVAALCGALSASLGTMVCNLTIGKKKYADVENEMLGIKAKLEAYQKEFFTLAEKDNKAFDKVMEAFKLPKETDSDKELRSKKIEEATIGAADVPILVIKLCKDILIPLKIVAEKGNKNSLSDAGVAVSVLKAAVQSAYLNVLINCASMNNQTFAKEMQKSSDILLEEIEFEAAAIFNLIVKSISAV